MTPGQQLAERAVVRFALRNGAMVEDPEGPWMLHAALRPIVGLVETLNGQSDADALLTPEGTY